MFPLIAENLVVEFQGKHILGPINLQIDKGDIAVILGPNGSGKTSLLKALHGILKLRLGTVRWSCLKAESIGKQMFVFQTPIMLRRSVFENLTYPLLLRKTPKAQANHRAAQWVDRIDLRALMHVPATRLSGGEKQKLALARALITEPEMLFLDEPCASLDGKTTFEIESLLQNCVKVANEPAYDLKANVRRNWALFPQSRLDESSNQTEFKSALFMFASYKIMKN